MSYDDAYNELQTMDSNSSTWIHEDPDLDTQKRWIKDNIKPIERSATGTADGAVKT